MVYVTGAASRAGLCQLTSWVRRALGAVVETCPRGGCVQRKGGSGGAKRSLLGYGRLPARAPIAELLGERRHHAGRDGKQVLRAIDEEDPFIRVVQGYDDEGRREPEHDVAAVILLVFPRASNAHPGDLQPEKHEGDHAEVAGFRGGEPVDAVHDGEGVRPGHAGAFGIALAVGDHGIVVGADAEGMIVQDHGGGVVEDHALVGAGYAAARRSGP